METNLLSVCFYVDVLISREAKNFQHNETIEEGLYDVLLVVVGVAVFVLHRQAHD